MRYQQTLFELSRASAVIAAVFASVIVMAYMALVVWDKTHPPRIPGWTAAPQAQHPASHKQHA